MAESPHPQTHSRAQVIPLKVVWQLRGSCCQGRIYIHWEGQSRCETPLSHCGCAEAAELIFCPYNYILDPVIRRAVQIDLQDSVIILDEAHNIEDICR